MRQFLSAEANWSSAPSGKRCRQVSQPDAIFRRFDWPARDAVLLVQAHEGHEDIDFDDQLMQMSPVTTFTKPRVHGPQSSQQQGKPVTTGPLLPGQLKALRGAEQWQESQMIMQRFGDYQH